MNPDYRECASCAAKPGAPRLCDACLHNRRIVDRLRALERLAQRWADAHAGHYRSATIDQPDEGPHVSRRTYLEAESALLEAIRNGGKR